MLGNLVGFVMQGRKEKEWSRLTKSLLFWDSFRILMFKSPSKMQFLSFIAGLLRIVVNVSMKLGIESECGQYIATM